MIGSLFPSTAFAFYSDVEQHWGQASIEKWSDIGIIKGSNGEFRPNDSITRGEMAVIIDRIMNYQTKSSKNFTDLGQDFYTDGILKATAAGVVQGYGTTVRPTDKITREEAVVMLGRALGLSESVTVSKTFSDSSKISSWAIGYVNVMANSGYINGSNGSFYPKSNITRAEAITILDNSIKELCSEAKYFTGDVSGVVIINTPGVVLKDMQINGDLIIAEGVGSGDATLDSVAVSGKVIIRGGGANSIHIIGNSKIANIIVQKTDDGTVRIATSDRAIVDAVVIDDGNDDIILTGSFGNVTIAADVTVMAVNAVIKNIVITSANATLNVDKDSKITEINVAETAIDGKIAINNQGTITKATVIEGVTLNGNKPLTLIAPTPPSLANTGGSSSSGGSSKITKAEFIAKISDYFAWPHPTEYNDIWKAPLKQFNDVETSDTYGKQIEVAYEENIISPDASGNFNPESKISRQDVAVIFAKAFKIADSDKTVEFSDSTSISKEAIKSVNALVELGYMSGKTATLFAPNDPITNAEVNSIFNKITSTTVAPVQALPKQTVEPYTAPRRFIKLYTPTDGAKIYYTKASSIEGWPTVEDPTTSSDEYVLAINGHISELVGSRSGELEVPDNYVVYKAIAVKDGKVSPVQTFKWHLNRPMDGEFLYKQLKEKTATSPAVYEIFRNNESVRAMAWYMEGADSGIVFDALQTPESVKNLKTFIDENIASKSYIAILGHEHGDHDAQVPNFINGGIDVYANQRGWAAIGSPGGFGAVVTTPEAQAKVKNVEEGMTFDLGGGTVFEVYALPGHANGNVGLYDRESGYLFSSDFYGCTRAGSADTVGISGVRADLLLSFVQQVYSNYTKDGSEVTALFTGHDESELNDNNLKLFEAALQQVVDKGEDGCTPSVRGSNNRTTMIGDMYEDGTNWIALELGGKMGDNKEYLSSTTDLSALPYMSDSKNTGLNYNAGGNVKYSVLSNIEIEGGELVGKTVQWAKDANEFLWNGEAMTVNPSLENRFNPWSYDYTINVPESNESITIIPTTMSTKVKSIKLNGKEIGYRSSNNVTVVDGTVITISITAPDNITTSTYSFTVEKGTAITAKDFNDYTTNLVIDYSQATQLPLTGYYTKAVGTDRSVKVYIPENASIRAKFTAITVPEGVDTYSFLDTQGWISRADENGECLFVLEPGKNGWGSQTEENDYIINAMKFLTSGTNDNKVSVFSNYGAFYLVGYNTGCALLESWSANNPLFVNSQVYINGTSAGQEYLDTVGAKKYNGKNTGGYDPGQDDDDFIQTLKDLGYDGTFMSQSEVPVPTWFIGYGDDSYSITYWKKANDVVSTPDGDVYHQDINSDAWQTQYANESILKNNPNAKYGMSQVKVSESANLSAEDIFKFHLNYIRYTTTFAYSNHLEYRLDYGKMTVDLQKKASSATVTSEVYNKPDGETGSYDFYAQADTKVKAYDDKTGTVISGIVALSDYNNDGKKDPRDYIAYVPDSAKEIWGDKGAPVVLVHPGMTQTASVFMDASMWWQVANDEGCVFIIVGEAYSSATGVSYKSDSAEFAYMLENIISSKISDYAKLDLTRIYGSGHSLGCRTIQDLSMSNPDLIAAVSSTSFPPSTTERTGEMMPNYFIHGQSDLPFELPDLWGNTGLQDWANYFFEANGLKTDINSYDSSNTSGRFHTYVWNNSQDIPMVKYGYTVAREHNCMPQEFTMGWDFLEHYSFEKDANGHVTARYYSPSGFKDDDRIQITLEEFKAVNFDEVSTPVVDFTKANKLPLTGYFEKDFSVGSIDRTAKVYIPENTPVRTYFTLIAVPNGVDTEEFLLESGWKALADKRAEGLFILESSKEGWGDFTEEQAYLTAAINFLGANSYFSIFGEHYLVGYDDGAPVLEAWAAANPLKVISQAYVNSKALTEDYLNQFATMEFGGTNGNYGVIEFPDGFEKIKYNEVVLPTWYINPDSAYSASLDYWKNANDCAYSSTVDGTFGTIYKQGEESDRWMTSHSGPISEVAVLNDVEFDYMNSDDTNNIYEFLSYYTRYENAVAYSNQLAVRADYEELGIEIRTMTVSGELREYMVYVPESAQTKWGDEAPAVFVFPGNSQTDKVFLDATQWWQVAQDEGFILVIVCEQNNISAPTTVSHKNTNQFYKQLKEVILSEYKADPTRIYATGQSAGSMVTQSLAIAVPECFAAIASTSGASDPSTAGTVNIDGVSHNASNKMIPNYFMYGAGDITSMTGDLWDGTQNSLDSWAAYHLGVNGFALGEYSNHVATGWMDRFKTWTWSKEIEEEDVPLVKVTQNLYRSHNCISEEMPLLWNFLKHYSYEVDENNNVTRYYSPSGFVEDDKILIVETEAESVRNVDTATPIADRSSTSDTNIGKYVVLGTTGQSPNFATVITGTAILADIESANEVQGVAKWIGVLITTDKKVINLSVMTPEATEFTALTQSDVNEAVAAGASGDNTFVWWLKAENLTDPNDILIKVTGEDDSTAVTLSVSYNPFDE